MAPDLFSYSHYQSYLADLLHSDPERWGMVSRIAKAIGCQRSQVSRILNGSMHFTIEQAFAFTQFWEFGEAETEYFLCLVEIARAGSKNFQERSERKRQRLQKENQTIAKRLKQPALAESEKEIVYYSAWYWAALHIAVSIPTLKTPEAIARYLSLPLGRVKISLEKLVEMGLVRRDGKHYEFSSDSMHLSSESPLHPVNMAGWRERAVESARYSDPRSIHYTVTQSLSHHDAAALKTQLLKTIEDFAKTAGPSPPEHLVCFNLDFFPVGR